MTGKVTAGDRRVLFTKWVGTAWQETSYPFICEILIPMISGSRDVEEDQ